MDIDNIDMYVQSWTLQWRISCRVSVVLSKNGVETPFIAPIWLSQHSFNSWETQIHSQPL